MKEFKTYMGDNLIQKFSENFPPLDRQSSSRSPEKKSRLEINETFTINRPTMPSEQTLSFPPTAADIVAYDAATSAHKARTRRKCSICYNDRRHCFCEAIYGSESDTEHEQTTNHSIVEAAGMINYDHANHGFRPHRPLADGDGDAYDTISEQDHITEARVSTDNDIANCETLISRAYNTMRATTRYLIEDAMLYSSSSSSSTSDDETNVDDNGVPNDTVEARQLIGAIIGAINDADGTAVAAVEVAAVEERHMDAGGATTNAESHEDLSLIHI